MEGLGNRTRAIALLIKSLANRNMLQPFSHVLSKDLVGIAMRANVLSVFGCRRFEARFECLVVRGIQFIATKASNPTHDADHNRGL